MTKFKLYIFLTVVLSPLVLAQDVSFQASVDKNPVAANDRFTLEFTVTTSGASARNFKTPDLSKFLVLSGPNQSTSMQIINGSVSSSQTFSYVLQPREAGKFTIGAATIEVGNNQYKSNPIELTVSKASAQSAQKQAQQQQDESVDVGDNLFLRGIIDRSRVVQGEQVTVTYKIYNRLNIVDFPNFKEPRFTSFWAEDLTEQRAIQWTYEVVDGKQYKVGIIKKVALFPTQTGALTIDPMELTCRVVVQSRRRSNDIFDQFFNDPFFGTTQTASVTLKSQPLKVTVLPLPQENVPQSFQGAVGKFSLKSELNKRRAKTNEPLTLKAVVSGTGNVKILEAPKLQLPNDFEQYDPKISESIQRSSGTINGSKTFEWLIVPRYPGEKKIPGLEFSYFDVAQRKFVTLRTNEFNVLVEKGSAEAPQLSGGLSKEDVKLLNQDIRFIKTSTGSFKKVNEELLNTTAAVIWTMIPLVAFIGLLVYRQKELSEMADVVSFRSRKAIKIASKRLHNAKMLLATNKSEEFYAEVSSALWQYVSDKLALDKAELSIDNVTMKLEEKKISGELTARIKECLEACEFARFAPGSSSKEGKSKMYDMASSIIVAAERELVR
ncbi:MAG: BatD family protein [Bacteroidota bacterium]